VNDPFTSSDDMNDSFMSSDRPLPSSRTECPWSGSTSVRQDPPAASAFSWRWFTKPRDSQPPIVMGTDTLGVPALSSANSR
jgi:hypothetical protein